MADEVDLDEERRAYIDIDAMHARLTSLSHYEALGVSRTADAKESTRAYFRLAAIVHPDRYFGKNLGSYKPKLSAVFSRINLAHETLSDPARRNVYDSALPQSATPNAPIDPIKAARQKEAMAALKARFTEGAAKAKTQAEEGARARGGRSRGCY